MKTYRFFLSKSPTSKVLPILAHMKNQSTSFFNALQPLLLLAALSFLLACTPVIQDDHTAILSLIYNTQIGNRDHLGTGELGQIISPDKIRAERDQQPRRKIIFFNEAKLNDYYKGWARDALKGYTIDQSFLEELTDWDKLDIKNESPYEIIHYDEFESGQIDATHVGIMTISAIAINETADKASLYYDWLCGKACGYGNIVLLEKRKGSWTLDEVIKAW